MTMQNVLAIIDKDDKPLLIDDVKSNNWNIDSVTISYKRLYDELPALRAILKSKKIDIVAYSRNDQIASKVNIGGVTGALQTGYTSFSGIDNAYRKEQMVSCFSDFVNCHNTLDMAAGPHIRRPSENYNGTFSLLFDTEQLGCVRYALPRLLTLLNKYDTKAVFFITNILKTVYTNVVDIITDQGHEVGLHGRWHEYLSSYDREEQSRFIKEMIDDLKIPVYGANFLGRMNQDTIAAMADNNIKYSVFPMANIYGLISYPRLPTNYYNIAGYDLKMFPVNIDTYGSPWFSVKNMIDSAVDVSARSSKHITVICHPFRDGNLAHIGVTEKMLKYMIEEKRLQPVLLRDLTGNDCEDIPVGDVFNMRPTIGSYIPTSRRDVTGFIPQNLMRACKSVVKRYTIW